MTWAKLLFAAAVALFSACLAGIGIAAWWIGTAAGTAWLVNALEPRISQWVTFADVSGALWEGVTIRDLHVHTGTMELFVERLAMTLDPAELLSGTIAVQRLDVGATRYRQVPAQTESESRPWALPLRIEVRDATVARLDLQAREEALAFEAIRLGAAMRGTTLTIESLQTTVAGAEVAGRGRLDLTEPLRVSVTLGWRLAWQGESLAGELEMEGEWPRFDLTHRLTAPFTADLQGEIVLEGAPAGSFDLAWSDMAWPGIDALGSPSGRLHLEGRVDAFAFEGAGELTVTGEAVRFEMDGRGEGPFLSFSTLALDHSAGSVVAAGEVALQPLEWWMQIEGRDLDPAARFAALPGRLQLAGMLHGRTQPELALTLSDAVAEGELRGQPLSVSGQVAYTAAEGWQLDLDRVVSGPNRAALHGHVGEQLDLDFTATVEALSALLPTSEGEITATGRIEGALQAPLLQVQAQASGLALQGYEVDGLRARASVGLDPQHPLRIEASAEGLRRGALAVERLEAHVSGTTGDHAVEVAIGAEQWTGHLSASGGVDERTWRGRVAALSIDQAMLGEWQLAGPADVVVGPEEVSLPSACLARGEARLCAVAHLAGRPEDRIELTAEAFDVASLSPLLPRTLALQGRYQASLSVAGLPEEPRGDLVLSGGRTRIGIELPGQEPFETHLESVSFSARLAERRLDLQGAVLGQDEESLTLSATVADVTAPDPPLQGHIGLLWPDVGLLSLLSPDVGEVGGRLNVDLAAAGTLDAPEVQGTAQWTGGHVSVPRWGLVIEDISADARSVDGANLEFSARGAVGDGQVNVVGITEIDRRAGWPTRLTVSGEEIQAVQLPEAQVFVSPNLDVEVRLPDVHATGTVHIPRAEIVLSELPAQAVAPSEDAVVHGVEAPEAVRPIRLHSDLRFTLGENVRYSGLGLTASVTGEMRLQYTSGRPSTASGTLSLDGRYDAYGQVLTLQRGQLLFNGPWDDPALDVSAVRRIEETTVGIQLTGTVKRPQTRIFSDPPLSEADALSYLLLGRPLTGTGEEDSATLQSAAVAMGLQQALPVVQRIGESLGLDELSVQTTETDTGALMAGKYLSPRVYIRYSYGLFNRIGGLLLRFRLSDRLSLETRSGDQKSMDVLYTVEKE